MRSKWALFFLRKGVCGCVCESTLWSRVSGAGHVSDAQPPTGAERPLSLSCNVGCWCVVRVTGVMKQLSISSLFYKKDDGNRPTDQEIEVYDLFCGAGGFSEGARQAGGKVVFACDSSKEAIKVHKSNHKDATHWCCELPRDDIPFPTDGRPFHVHGSPPCQAFSTSGKKDAALIHAASDLIQWYILTALQSGATTWTMEQVASVHVISILENIRAKYRDRLAFYTFNFADLGVPQTRRRILAGTPHLIASIMRKQGKDMRVSIAASVPNPRGTHIRSTLYHTHYRKRRIDEEQTSRKARNVYIKAEWSRSCYPISGQAPTIIAGRNSGWWIRFEGNRTVRSVLSTTDVSALQTFPVTYKLPLQPRYLGFRLVGNAVPPKVAKIVMECASALRP